jgi:methionyl-tRNA synthetase
LLAHLHTTKDSDFREDLLRAAYGAELAGKLGNLLQRVCALCVQSGVCTEPGAPSAELDPALQNLAKQARFKVEKAVSQFALHEAVRAVFELVAGANRYADQSAPWQLAKLQRDAPTATERERASGALRRSLGSLVEALLAIAELLEPFLPSTARSVRARLVPYPSLGEPLFPALRRELEPLTSA